MTLRFAAAAAALALSAVGWTGAAQAQSFDDFMTVCGSTDLDPISVRAAADGLGWVALPTGALAAFASEPGEEDPFEPLFVMTAPGDDVGLLIFAQSEMPLGDRAADADLCMFMTETVSEAEARGRLKALGLASLIEDDAEGADDDGGVFMVFSRGPDGVRDEGALGEASEEEIAAVLRDRPVFMMGVEPSATDVGLLMVRFRGAGLSAGGN